MKSIPGILFLFFIVFSSLACNRDDDEDGNLVPIVATDITLQLNLPSYAALQNPGGWAYVTGGSRGIIVYRSGINEFSAFDRHCTYQVPEGCRISVIESVLAKDTVCCGSEFELLSGTPSEGPARFPLRAYQTQYNPNANLLRIYN